MSVQKAMDAKVYKHSEGRSLSLQDLLDYFRRQGSMRVSDLHLKVGCPPVYRVDGDLQKLKGPPLDKPAVEAFVAALLNEAETEVYRQHGSVDRSFMTETMQFRLNCFRDSDGPAIAIRALEATAPAVEQIGFPNRSGATSSSASRAWCW